VKAPGALPCVEPFCCCRWGDRLGEAQAAQPAGQEERAQVGVGGLGQQALEQLLGDRLGCLPRHLASRARVAHLVQARRVEGERCFAGSSRFTPGFRIRHAPVFFEPLQPVLCLLTASPVLIDGKVYAPSEQGDVSVFEAVPRSDLPTVLARLHARNEGRPGGVTAGAGPRSGSAAGTASS
jgi:hypothetical protein